MLSSFGVVIRYEYEYGFSSLSRLLFFNLNFFSSNLFFNSSSSCWVRLSLKLLRLLCPRGIFMKLFPVHSLASSLKVTTFVCLVVQYILKLSDWSRSLISLTNFYNRLVIFVLWLVGIKFLTAFGCFSLASSFSKSTVIPKWFPLRILEFVLSISISVSFAFLESTAKVCILPLPLALPFVPRFTSSPVKSYFYVVVQLRSLSLRRLVDVKTEF